MTDIIDEAKKYWENGFNCSQAAACGILDFYGYEQQSEIMKKALLPFGGGIGERSICGSLTGALAGLSTVLHERGLERDSMYQHHKKLKTRFKEEIGTLRCREIIQDWILPDGSVDKDNPDRRKACDKTVFQAVTIVKEIIDAL
jgi:C_GCAxxG_C_C family probable redox protein